MIVVDGTEKKPPEQKLSVFEDWDFLGIFGLIKNRKKSSQSKFVAVSFNIKSESAK